MRAEKRLALLVNDCFGAYQAAFRTTIERAAQRRGCRLLVFNGRSLGHPDPHERVQNALFDWASPRIVDGAIVLSGTVAHFADRAQMARMCARLGEVPVVSIGLELPGFASIVMQNRAALARAVEHVIQRHGRRRVAYIGGPLGNEEAADRLAGYHDALRAQGIAADEALVTSGLFTLPSGTACMQGLLASGAPFDAVVAANDQMAMGAMDVVRAQGLRVPEDVVVVGFDDTPIAQFAARSLTTVAQPIDAMGEAGVEAILDALDAGATRASPATRSFQGRLVLRESCGCGQAAARTAATTAAAPATTLTEYVRGHRASLVDESSPRGDTTPAAWRARWAPRLIDALAADLEGAGGAFLREIEQTGDEVRREHASVEEIGRFVGGLQGALDGAGYRGAAQFDLEQLWTRAQAIVSTMISRAEARAALVQIEASVDLRYLAQRLAVAFDVGTMTAELERSLPQLGIDTAYVALRPTGDADQLRPLLALDGGRSASDWLRPQPADRPLPDGFPSRGCRCLLLWAITFERETLGLIALDGAADPLVGESIRAQLGASLKMGELHGRVVEQTALQERFARERLAHEVETAKRIQTALAPKQPQAPGFRFATASVPADDVGGDYHDVLPAADGCWLGIGDVAGHGLMSGLIMLMIQNVVAALVDARPDASPTELVCSLNRVLVANLRDRMQREEHATFTLFRLFDDGRVRFAGAHEDVLVWRAAARAIDVVETDGTWLGLMADVRSATTDRDLALASGDVMLLFTDGVTEARNARGERFGVPALLRLLETHADRGPEAVRDEVFAAVRAWAPVLQDDVTCVVVRYEGTGA